MTRRAYKGLSHILLKALSITMKQKYAKLVNKVTTVNRMLIVRNYFPVKWTLVRGKRCRGKSQSPYFLTTTLSQVHISIISFTFIHVHKCNTSLPSPYSPKQDIRETRLVVTTYNAGWHFLSRVSSKSDPIQMISQSLTSHNPFQTLH